RHAARSRIWSPTSRGQATTSRRGCGDGYEGCRAGTAGPPSSQNCARCAADRSSASRAAPPRQVCLIIRWVDLAMVRVDRTLGKTTFLGLVAGALAVAGLAGCSAEAATPTLTWYVNPDNG